MSQTPSPNSDPREIYFQMREIAFGLTRDKLHLAGATKPLEPFGVILEMGMDRGAATLVTFADGTASLYFSTGGGFIGGQGQPTVNAAAKRVVAEAVQFVQMMTPVSSFPLPQVGQHVLYAFTDKGVWSSSGHEKDFASARHPLTPLWMACQNVITQFRLLRTSPPK